MMAQSSQIRVIAPEKSPKAHYESSYLKRMNSKTSSLASPSRPGRSSRMTPIDKTLSQKDTLVRTTSYQSKRALKQSRYMRSNSTNEKRGKGGSSHRSRSMTPSRRDKEARYEIQETRQTSPQRRSGSTQRTSTERQRHLNSLVEKTLQTSTRRLEHNLAVTTVKKKNTFSLPEVNSFRYWTTLSIKVSTALIKSGAPQNIAEASQYAVMEHGQKMPDYSNESLNLVASKASLAAMEAGGSPNLAAVATVACLRGVDAEDDDVVIKKKVLKYVDDATEAVKKKAVDGSELVRDLSFKAYDTISEAAGSLSGTLSEYAHEGYEELKRMRELEMKRQDEIWRRKELRRQQKQQQQQQQQQLPKKAESESSSSSDSSSEDENLKPSRRMSKKKSSRVRHLPRFPSKRRSVREGSRRLHPKILSRSVSRTHSRTARRRSVSRNRSLARMQDNSSSSSESFSESASSSSNSRRTFMT